MYIRFIYSAQNYQRMPNVIAFNKREKDISEILHDYDLKMISEMPVEELYREFRDRKKFSKKCKEMHRKIGMLREEKTATIVKWVNQVLEGYYRYYGVYGNYPMVISFRWNVLKSLFYWLNRRSQKKSYTWIGFLEMIDKGHPVARPKTYYVVI